jgi:hypothetical protein
MDPNLKAVLTFLTAHSQDVLKLVSITFAGMILMVPYLEDFKVMVGLKTRITGRTRRLRGQSSWRNFAQLIICVVVFVAMAWVLMKAG